MTQANKLKKTKPVASKPTQKKSAQKQTEAPRLVIIENGQIIFSNDAFQDVIGTKANIIGQNIRDLFNFDGHSISDIQGITSGQHNISLQNNKKQLLLQFDWIDTPSKNRYLIASAEEAIAPKQLLKYITEKVESLENVTAKFEDPFASLATETKIILDSTYNFKIIDSIFTNILGYKLEQINDKNLINLIYFQDQEAIKTQLETQTAPAPFSFEARFISANEELIWMKWSCVEQDQKIYAVGHDTTIEKENEQLIARHQKELSEAEAIGHMGQWRWPVGSDELNLSPEIYHIFGLSTEGFVPTLDSINKMIFRRDAGRMTQVFQRAIIEQNDYDVDFRIKRPDGETRYIRCEGRCEIDPADDDVVALYGIMQDVTDSTVRELDLLKAKNSVERAYAAKTQFLANMSHELRTPLNAIIGFSEMIQRQLLGPIGTEKYLEYIDGIRESGEHLLDLISDILDMSKIEAGKYELSLENFNIAKLIRMAVHMMEGRALDSNIKIDVALDNEGLQIVADRRAIMQMVLNLLSNAVKFSKQNGRVTISLHERDNYISIKVADTGIGIPANKLANITQPFEQAECHYTREHEGSGLGLAITKELTEIHGGTLHIESTIDVGTTVTIRVPYDATDACRQRKKAKDVY